MGIDKASGSSRPHKDEVEVTTGTDETVLVHYLDVNRCASQRDGQSSKRGCSDRELELSIIYQSKENLKLSTTLILHLLL